MIEDIWSEFWSAWGESAGKVIDSQMLSLQTFQDAYEHINTEPRGPYVVVLAPKVFKMFRVAIKESERWEITYARWNKYPQHGRRAKRMKGRAK